MGLISIWIIYQIALIILNNFISLEQKKFSFSNEFFFRSLHFLFFCFSNKNFWEMEETTNKHDAWPTHLFDCCSGSLFFSSSSSMLDESSCKSFFLFVCFQKEEQVCVCGDFSAPLAWKLKDGVTHAICRRTAVFLKIPSQWQNLNLNDILLGLVVVLIVLILFVLYVSVIVSVFMGLQWEV